jgi:hypothetical protein
LYYTGIGYTGMIITTHKNNQATKPKLQLVKNDSTQHHPAPTARAQQSFVGRARPRRKHAPLDLANNQTPDTGNNYPNPTLSPSAGEARRI